MVLVRDAARRRAHELTIADDTPRGGRRAALAALARIRPGVYARSRNFLDGAVSRLSPYLRHGLLALDEVRDAAVRSAPRGEVWKFVQELAWRDYYVRIHAAIGDGVWEDLEPYKTGEPAASYAGSLPPDIESGSTGAACIDGFVRELATTGYLHNHARMWFASYVVHHRRVRWQSGAAFFLRLLLDGDAASNNLSWQWVASTFAHKPYLFNRENLEKYTRGRYCAACPLASGGCPFDASYADLDDRLFPNGRRPVAVVDGAGDGADLRVAADVPRRTAVPGGPTIVWQHDESLAETDTARVLVPGAPAIYVRDRESERRDPWSAARETFVAESVAESAVARVARGNAVDEIAGFAARAGATAIVATAPVDPRLRAIATALAQTFAVAIVDPPRLAELDRAVDLRRFSRYWSRAERTAFGPDLAETGTTVS